VEIQATIYDNIRSGMSIAEARLPTVAACILISVLLAATTVWRSTGWLTIVTSAAALLAFAAVSAAGMRRAHIVVSPLGPTVAYISVVFGQAAFDV
ncbi:adenylate/guanylate cyclase domain-containing protein, partial [Rhizobium leguminosarum]